MVAAKGCNEAHMKAIGTFVEYGGAADVTLRMRSKATVMKPRAKTTLRPAFWMGSISRVRSIPTGRRMTMPRKESKCAARCGTQTGAQERLTRQLDRDIKHPNHNEDRSNMG